MSEKTWTVNLSKKALKQKMELPERYQYMVSSLEVDLREHGPIQTDWPHFSSLYRKRIRYHCHLQKKGHPTYVAIWDVLDRKIRLIKIEYVGTREGAPYKKK